MSIKITNKDMASLIAESNQEEEMIKTIFDDLSYSRKRSLINELLEEIVTADYPIIIEHMDHLSGKDRAEFHREISEILTRPSMEEREVFFTDGVEACSE